MKKSVDWADLDRSALARARDTGALVVVPTGATEQHGDHLPVATDSRLAEAVARRAAGQASGPVVVAPTVAVGFSPHHLAFAGTLSLRLDTYLSVLRDISASVLGVGFPRLLFVNGHGGNSAPLRALCTELVTDGQAAGMVDYFSPGRAEWEPMLAGKLGTVGHACEFETALTLALMDGDPVGQAALIACVKDLPPRLTQPWSPQGAADPISRAGAGWPPVFAANDCGYFGDPAAADPVNGRDILEATVRNLALFFDDFAAAPLTLGQTSSKS